MSVQNSNIWLPNGSGSLSTGEICCDTSVRMDQKRGHQWLVDVSEQELFFNKKQAVEPVKESSEPAVMDGSLWNRDPGSQMGCPAGDNLFSLNPVRCANISDTNHPSIIHNAGNMEKSTFENQFGNEYSVCLTMSRAVEDPLCLGTGIRKVDVNNARMLELPEFVGNSCRPGVHDRILSAAPPHTGISMYPLPTYSTTAGNPSSADPSFSKMNENLISVGPASGTRDGSSVLTSQYYNGIGNNALSIGQIFNRGNYNINILGGQYEKENSSFMSIGPTYSSGQATFYSTDSFYNKVNETFMSSGSAYGGGNRNIAIGAQQDATVVSLGALCNKENSSILSTVENTLKDQQTTISFGGFQDNVEGSSHSGKLINSCPSAQSGVLGHEGSAKQLNPNVVSAATSRSDNAQKNKEKTKKTSSNNFPSNVKSLLSTGILDGVPVKYVSWSREKNLRAVIKGTGYLCTCDDCKLSKVINAYEFERHAGCKTKHPNNHIYFENGKTIYAVVQELKSTPQERLFEVMQNVTGSHINQKNFDAWKASYQAATRELQRIYGKDDTVVPP